MKKKGAVMMAVFILAAFCGGILWWNTPVNLLKNVFPAEINVVYVFDRETGETFWVQEPENIEYIVENIREKDLKREVFSQKYFDFRFELTFFKNNGGIAEEFRVISDNALQKGSFCYCDETNGICFDFLEALEGKSS